MKKTLSVLVSREIIKMTETVSKCRAEGLLTRFYHVMQKMYSILSSGAGYSYCPC